MTPPLPSDSARPRRSTPRAPLAALRALIALALFACGVGGADLAAAGELDSSRAFDALCRLSEPDPSSDAAAAALLLTSLESAPALTDSTRTSARRAYSGRRTDAMMETWHVSVPADAWTVAHSDPLVGELTVGAWGALELYPDTADAVTLDEELIALPCAPDAIEAATVAHAAGLARLDVEIELAAANDLAASVCTERPRHDGARQVAGNLLTARIVHAGTGEVLCETRTPRAEERDVRFADVAPSDRWVPRVEVTRVDLISEGGAHNEPLDDAREAHVRGEVAAELLPCYQAALCRRGQRQGALSVRATIDDGTLRDPAITVDALDSESIASCVVQRLERVRLDDALGGTHLGLVLIFRLVSDLDDDLALRALRDVASSALSGAGGVRGDQGR